MIKFDFSLMPTTYDMVHVGLAATILVLLLLLVIFLCVAVIALLRRPRHVAPTVSNEKAIAPPVARKEVHKEAPPKTTTLREAAPDAAVQLLGLLQQEARFIDFIEENVGAYSDADIGAAARVVHEGCHKILHNYFEFSPVRSEKEDSRVTLPKGFDSSEVRLTGNIVGKAPFTGTLVHRGWRIDDVKLPKLAEGHNVNIIASAEVEL